MSFSFRCDSAQFSIRDTLYLNRGGTVAPTRWASIQSDFTELGLATVPMPSGADVVFRLGRGLTGSFVRTELRASATSTHRPWSGWNVSLRLAVAPAWPATPVDVAQPATRRIHPSGSPSLPRSIHDKLLIAISESRKPRQNSARYPVNAGLKWLTSARSSRNDEHCPPVGKDFRCSRHRTILAIGLHKT